MRKLWVLAVCAAALSRAGLALAQAPPAEPAAIDEQRLTLARRHFENGVKLYKDQNFGGALAEFEAAYRSKPGAGSLQNVALCLKALFRYAEAASTLETLLSRHATELSDDEKQKVRTAIEELKSLVGNLRIKLIPPHAQLIVDGRSLQAAELASLRLDVGEHTVVAEAPGYARTTETVRIAGGGEQSLEISLRPTSGFVSVETQDPQAAIAIDGKALAFQRWSGPVSPGRHYVQVYKKGFATFERVITVEVGKSQEIKAAVGAPTSADEPTAPAAAPSKQTRTLRGWYGLAALSFLGIDEAPTDVDIENARETAGASFGVRAGYRIWTPVGVEMLLEGGRHEVKGACPADPQPGNEDCNIDYTLESLRVGGNVRLMSGGERVRFASTVGVGAVRHKYDRESISAKGTDPYFLLEVGVQLNLGHLLAEAAVVAYVDGASAVRDTSDRAPFGENSGLRMIGLGLRAGWSEWRPSSGTPLASAPAGK